MPKPIPPPVDVAVDSLYGLVEQRGLVQLRLGATQVQMTPTKARMIAGWLLEAAASAESDDALIRFLRAMEVREDQALAAMLVEVRRHRDAARRDFLETDHGG